jgi:hypothetical protein
MDYLTERNERLVQKTVLFILPVFSLSLKHLKASEANLLSSRPGQPFSRPSSHVVKSTRPRDSRNMYSLIHAMSLISQNQNTRDNTVFSLPNQLFFMLASVKNNYLFDKKKEYFFSPGCFLHENKK